MVLVFGAALFVLGLPSLLFRVCLSSRLCVRSCAAFFGRLFSEESYIFWGKASNQWLSLIFIGPNNFCFTNGPLEVFKIAIGKFEDLI